MVRKQLETQSKTQRAHTIVGHVVDYFEVPDGGFYVIYTIHPQWTDVIWMITEGKSSGLSMTHYPLNNKKKNVMPYEVSLCFEPARPHCYSIVGSPTLLGALNYKRRLISGSIGDWSESLARPTKVPIMTDKMETEVAPPAAAPTPIEAALSSIPDEGQRALVAARLADMMKHVDAKEKDVAKMEAEKAKLAEELAAASKNSFNAKTQADLLKAQLQTVTSTLGEDMCQKFQLDPAVTDKAIDSRDFAQLAMVTDRALMACSRVMMLGDSGSSRKRGGSALTPDLAARIEETTGQTMEVAAPAAAAAAPAMDTGLKAASAADMSPDDYLRRAMQSTARSFRGTPVGHYE